MTDTSIDPSYRTYLFSYNHAGATWVFEVRATDEADAKARLSKIAAANFDGELLLKVPLSSWPFGRIAAAIANGFSRIFTRSGGFHA